MRRGPGTSDVVALAALSKSLCYFPGCPVPIVTAVGDRVRLSVDVAYIAAIDSGGPRFGPSMPAEEPGRFANLVLLCPNHHSLIDHEPDIYTMDVLREWKRQAENSLPDTLAQDRSLNETRLKQGIVQASIGARQTIFLCHSSGDKAQVRELYAKLTANGYDCWLDEEDLLGGQDFDREITLAIERSEYVLACISKRSVSKRGYIEKELKKALDVAEQQPEGTVFLIPVRLEECEMPMRLSHLHRIDLFAPSGYQRLLKSMPRRATD